jgi:phosphoribosyl 1,2-cyclic phosphodiesterase/ActR/RegA family two-component response regulator
MTQQKILNFYIVDDDPAMIALLTTLIESAGHMAAGNRDSTDAVAEIAALKPDCVLADLMMPGMDGFALCEELRRTEGLENITLIVISAKAYEFDRKRAFEFGADGYITKPIDVETFLPSVMRVLEDKVEISFWGVRGTLPVPGTRTVRYGGNTSCVSVGFSSGKMLIFDAGSGIKALSDHLLAEKQTRLEAKIFISHPHWDHINALPFFAPLFMQGNEFEIFGAHQGDLTTREVISAQMDGVYFPITLKEFAARVYFRDLKDQMVEVDQAEVRSMLLSHPGRCLGYRVDYKGRSVCYVTDNELFLESSRYYNPHYVKTLTEFVAGTDAFITDCTYTDEEYLTKEGWGHSSIGEVVKLAHNAKVKNLYLFHHDPDQMDEDIDRKLEAAREMLEELGSSTHCIAPCDGQTFRI